LNSRPGIGTAAITKTAGGINNQANLTFEGENEKRPGEARRQYSGGLMARTSRSTREKWMKLRCHYKV